MVNYLLLLFALLHQQPLRDSVWVETPIFKVMYSETLEQPLYLIYRSTNRPKHVKRGNLNFHVDSLIHTSDDADYKNNEWDKGHLAPAATFSDTRENLVATFTYLNSSLQQQDLNRGEWRKLEEQERKWDDTQPLTVTEILVFSDSSKKLPTGATIPDGFHKHILFETTGEMKCFYFPNVKPSKSWKEYQEECH